MASSEIRQQIRDAADGVLIDALATFVALVQEEGLGVEATVVLEEWSSALVECTQAARECLETSRTLGESPGEPLDTVLEARVNELIAQRRRSLRESRASEEVECTVCNGPCQGH